MELVGIGIATIDVIQEIDAYPEEDSKVRARADGSRALRWNASHLCRFLAIDSSAVVQKNAAISSQLGCVCHWLGTTTDPERDADAAFVAADLASFRIQTSAADVLPTGSMPVSYILASKATGSRTIIHQRDLPELTFGAFCRGYDQIATSSTSESLWVHFEGRNLDNVAQMIEHLRSRAEYTAISLEVEALRHDWQYMQQLLKRVDVAFVSKDYIRKKLKLRDAAAFFQHLQELRGCDWRPRAIICPWGGDGVYYLDVTFETERHISTAPLDRAVDSVGAGDSFIGAALAALTHGLPLDAALRVACQIATAKCGQQGFQLSNELKSAILPRLTGRAN